MTRPPSVLPVGYTAWLAGLKTRIDATRLRVALAVNSELIDLYWQIGHEIRERQTTQDWGAGIVSRLAAGLRVEFPGPRPLFDPRRRRVVDLCRDAPRPDAFSSAGPGAARQKRPTAGIAATRSAGREHGENPPFDGWRGSGLQAIRLFGLRNDGQAAPTFFAAALQGRNP